MAERQSKTSVTPIKMNGALFTKPVYCGIKIVFSYKIYRKGDNHGKD